MAREISRKSCTKGAWIPDVSAYVERNLLCSEDKYPYESKKTGECESRVQRCFKRSSVRITDFKYTKKNAKDIMKAVAEFGPVVVTMNYPEGFFVCLSFCS